MSFNSSPPFMKRWVMVALQNIGINPNNPDIKTANLNLIYDRDDYRAIGYRGSQPPYYLTINRQMIPNVIFTDMGKILKRV